MFLCLSGSHHHFFVFKSNQLFLFIVDILEPNSEYVISLRAYNDMGDGRPVYVSVHTKEMMAPEPISPLIPPVGLMAIVLSSTTVVVYWTDTTLSKSQVM
jgi:hypothetical protein